ncbi:F-box protein At5g03970-like isoform X2 [Lolium perenne]|uniref:F-box protein At5g03970-like isoform X2 n=1 Tax=Lolium perenne TaxID=4522 RepID=UPI003A9A25BD
MQVNNVRTEDGEMRKKTGEMTVSLGHRPDSPPLPLLLEVDHLLEEILLRLHPLPSSLPRASLVSHRWRRLVSDPGFFRRFRLHHRRNPPHLGFFDVDSHDLHFVPALDAPDRVPPGRFSLQFNEGDKFHLLGSRHGLVLVLQPPRKQLLVWDPITADQHHINLPPGFAGPVFAIHGAVLRDAVYAQHFQVVLVDVEAEDPHHSRVLACVYSSETGVWGDLISAPLPPMVPSSNRVVFVYPTKPAVLVENSLYWILDGDLVGILEFDLERKSIAVIQPPVDVLTKSKYQYTVVRTEGGGLGFLFVSRSQYNAQLWKRKTNLDGVASWVLERTIELEKLLSLNSGARVNLCVRGFAEDNNVLFLGTPIGVFMIHIESLQFKKLPDHTLVSCNHSFESVYAAV